MDTALKGLLGFFMLVFIVIDVVAVGLGIASAIINGGVEQKCKQFGYADGFDNGFGTFCVKYENGLAVVTNIETIEDW